MTKKAISNRIKKITSLLNIVKLQISIRDDDGKVKFSIAKSNNRNQKPFEYRLKHINFSEIFSEGFEYSWAHYACHEIAHFIVSAKKRRSKKDYNLINKSKEFSYFEEAKVLAVNNYLLIKFGYVKTDDIFFNMGKFGKNKLKLKEWWELEGNIIAKTYVGLV